MVIKRGEIWWANLEEPVGSEPGFKRPVVIVQANSFNQSLIQTIIVVAVSSNLNLARAPGNVVLPKKITKLSKDSVANVSQVLTIDKSFLLEKVSKLPDTLLNDLNSGLRLVLDLA